MSNADDEVLAPAMTKLNVFSLSDEEKAERADMAGKLSEGQYRQWLKERKQAYQEQQAAAQAQAEKQLARGKRAQAQKRTSMKGESLQASRQLYTASWENDAEARRKAILSMVKQRAEKKLQEKVLREAAAKAAQEQMNQAQLQLQQEEQEERKQLEADMQVKIDQHLQRIKEIDLDAEQRFIAMNIACERMEVAQVDGQLYAVPMGKEAEWASHEIQQKGQVFDISYYIQIDSEKVEFPQSMKDRRNLQLELQLQWNQGQKPKAGKSAAEMTKEVTDVQRIFSELELEVQKLHEIVNSPGSVGKRQIKIEGYKKESLSKMGAK